ncbi:LamG-like jellyroll fold domain-containing protein, partial [Haloferula sargassicola]|uniref:LamG-like jellyroll fold domain-containing protein n=1 Tax=Haloferula sargassicola TaxID=490096 RepID=UPI0033657FBD
MRAQVPKAFIGLCLLPILGRLQAQTFLEFVESPASSGLFVDDFSGNYIATGSSNGIQRVFNAVSGDRLTVRVETERQTGASPIISLADAGGSNLVTVTGDSRGRALLQNFAITSPGVYSLNFYSNSAPSAFEAQVLLSRGFQQETEANDLAATADSYPAAATGGSFTLNAAGILDGSPDWIDLGTLASGANVNFSLQAPSTSTLDLSGLQLALWRDGDASAQTVVTGASLSHAVSAAGRYRVEVAIPGPAGQHLRFTGDGDHVNLGSPSALQIAGSQTIEFWIRPDRLGVRQNPFEKAYGGEGTMTIENGGDINYYYGTNGGNGSNYQQVNSSAALRVGEWAHVAVVRDFDVSPQKIRWYFNGRLTAETDASYVPGVAGTRDFVIGTGYAGSFAGSIDEFRVWNVARSEAELLAGMSTAPAPGTPGLVAEYSFEEGSGDAVTDGSGNGVDGTISGTLAREGGGGDLARYSSQGLRGTWFVEAVVGDTTAPAVATGDLIPFTGYLFDGTTAAPADMTAQRGNNGSEHLYTVVGSTSGTLKGTGLYTDDSSIARAAVHAGLLLPGERGAVKVTVQPGSESYVSSTNHGTSSSYSGAFPGSFTLERYEPASPFTLDAIYNRLWIRFSEEINPATLTAAASLHAPGIDGIPGNADDVAVPLVLDSIEDDHRYVFSFGGRILTAGTHRLTIAASVADRAGNTMAAPYTQDFDIVDPGFTTEDGDNDSFASADSLSLAPDLGAFDSSFVNSGISQSSAGADPRDIVSADFDKDGLLDAAVGYAGADQVSVFPGNGDGSFGTPVSFPAGGDVWGVALIDFDKDGLTDIVAAARSVDGIVLLQNTSTPGSLSFTRLT